MKKKLSYLNLMQCFASIFKGPPEFMTCNFYGSTSQYVKLNILLSNYLSNFLALWILFTGRTFKLDWLHVVLL